jgi:hypothetical protein
MLPSLESASATFVVESGAKTALASAVATDGRELSLANKV